MAIGGKCQRLALTVSSTMWRLPTYAVYPRLWMLLHLQERSRINTNNRSKLKVHHPGGSRPFVWHRKEVARPKGGTPTAIDLYSKTHHKKNGEGWVSDVARENYEKMVDIQSQSTIESGAPKDVDIFTQVLGKKIWLCERDLELVRELEAAKATIEELKSRQSEYDNLKNQQEECRRHRGKFKSNFNYLRHNLHNEIRR
ncbi:hypothetical protein CJ030_MR0G006178 [Morella rubra]|uniref:Uncharacterized protein n=1 Tax=Morella rubra TaxID=262757 RepID=A0A6A1UKK9_9ROSI|nr:hypothetical protein CJ030_MR0G006178 [Morella rubra]